MTEIKDALLDVNPWWRGEFTVEFKERELHSQIRKYLRLPQIIALTGLRRVGKTTLMLKSAEDAIREGLDPKNVIYFSFDEFKGIEIRSVLREYETMMEKSLRTGKYLLLLDEIQKLNDWENQLKAIYDAFGKNVKVMISGSESLFIRRKSRETLAGRMFEFKVEPLTFKEFLNFKGVEYKPVGLHERELEKQFAEFVLSLGFPELVGIKERDVIRKYVNESIVEKVIYRDIPELVSIKDISALRSLLDTLMTEPGQLLELSHLASDLNLTRQTVSLYLTYLEDSFLVRKLYNFSRSRRKVERKLRKYYPTLISPDIIFKNDELSRSKVFEWLVVNQTRPAFFWRDPYKHEVDMILANGRPMPIEIKYGKIDLDGLLFFMRKFNVNDGLVISSTLEERRKVDSKRISVIPAFKFLLK